MLDAVTATAMLVGELGRADLGPPPARHAEIATMLRLAGEVSVADGRSTIRAEFRTPEAAARLRDAIATMYGRAGVVDTTYGRGGTRRCGVRVAAAGTDLARATGLVDRSGRSLPALPAAMLSATTTAAAVWRGALLASGSVGRWRGRPQIQVVCPGQPVALTLSEAARRLGISARDRETADRHRVVVHDPDSITTLLRTTGAPATAEAVGEPDSPTGIDELDAYNAERAAAAGAASAERARRALDVLGDAVPDSLREVGRLRADRADLSLAQLGRLADPPLTRNAVSARLQRLFAAAEQFPRIPGQTGPDARR